MYLDTCIWNDNQFIYIKYRLGRYSFNFYIASLFLYFYKYSGRASILLELLFIIIETRKQVLGKEYRYIFITIEEIISLYVQQAR
jgi:hypothetical protein